MCKIFFILFVIFFHVIWLPVQSAAAQDAASIIEGARNRIGVKTISSRSRMELTAKNGGKTERLIDQFSKDNADGKKILVVFQKPASVAGTRFLTVTKNGLTGSGSDKWIFLPSLAKVRRISSAEGSGSFVGTDLSYDDISSTDRDVSLDNHTLLREETLNGNQCYVVQSVPKDKGYQYSKMILWISKTDKITYKIELYNKKEILHKILQVLEVKKIQNYDTPVRSKMTTVPAGTSTEIFVESIKYGEAIPDGVFSQNYLETGRQ